MSSAAANLPPVLGVTDLADLFRVGLRTAYELGKRIPPCTPKGVHRRWARDTVLAWMAQNEAAWLDSTNVRAPPFTTPAGRTRKGSTTANRPGQQIADSLRTSCLRGSGKPSTAEQE